MVNTLKDYLQSLELSIIQTIGGTMELDEESVHDFRVGLKKTRTMLNFIHFWLYRKSEKVSLYRQLRPIFQRTGKIRELHIHHSLLSELGEQTDLNLDFLEKKISYQITRNREPLKREMKKFEKAYPKISGQIISQIDSAGQLNQRIDAPQAFQIRLEKRIQKQLDSEKPDLHLIRRIIKQKVYVFDTFQESELLSFYQEFRAEWKILESSMGKWHDQLVFQFWLNKGLKWKRLKDEEYKTMLKLIAWLKSSTDRMEEQLINSIPRVNI